MTAHAFQASNPNQLIQTLMSGTHAVRRTELSDSAKAYLEERADLRANALPVAALPATKPFSPPVEADHDLEDEPALDLTEEDEAHFLEFGAKRLAISMIGQAIADYVEAPNDAERNRILNWFLGSPSLLPFDMAADILSYGDTGFNDVPALAWVRALKEDAKSVRRAFADYQRIQTRTLSRQGETRSSSVVEFMTGSRDNAKANGNVIENSDDVALESETPRERPTGMRVC